jgi:hypothetical protein
VLIKLLPLFSLNLDVKKKGAYLLILFYLLATTELNQLLKLPLLVGHYLEHQTNTENLSIYQFLYIHYANGNVKDADYEKDMKLPFKANNNFLLQTNVISPPSIFIVTPNKNLSKIIQKKFFYTNDRLITSAYLSNIWQPPKTTC